LFGDLVLVGAASTSAFERAIRSALDGHLDAARFHDLQRRAVRVSRASEA
jgi:hypothetical protein